MTSAGTDHNVEQPGKYSEGGWEDYLLCLLFHMIFPLGPLLVEWGSTAAITGCGVVELKSMSMTLAIYAVSIGISSRQRLQFALMMLLSFMGILIFGMVTCFDAWQKPLHYRGFLTYGIIASIVIIFFTHARERYGIHVKRKELYWALISSHSG